MNNMGGEIPKPSEVTQLISSSGCLVIQAALADMTEHGMTPDDLDPETLDAVVGTIASAASVGGQAAPKE